MDTPFQWIKQIASHYGETRNGTVICTSFTDSLTGSVSLPPGQYHR